MAIQYYNIQSTGEKFALDKSTGKATKIGAIPSGAPTITWGGRSLPGELQKAISTPAATPRSQPAPSTGTPSPAPRGRLEAIADVKPPVPQELIDTQRDLIQKGIVTPAQARSNLQSIVSSGVFGGFDESALFAPLEDIVLPQGARGKFALGGTGEIIRTTPIIERSITEASGQTTTIPGVGTLTTVPKQFSAAGLNVDTSVVDFLKSIGADSSFSARSELAKQFGIVDYQGTADQNVALLNQLKAQNEAGLFARTGVTPGPSLAEPTGPGEVAPAGTGTTANDTIQGVVDLQSTLSNAGVGDLRTLPESVNLDDFFSAHGLNAPPVFGVDTKTRDEIAQTYNSYIDTLITLNKDLVNTLQPTEREQALQEELLAVTRGERAGVEKVEGEPIPTAFQVGQQREIARQAALDRLGISEEIKIEQGKRELAFDVAKQRLANENTVFSTRLDLIKEMRDMDVDTQNEARNFLLDVLDFSKGFTWEELDANTQMGILAGVANSPITLDMVKKALKAQLPEKESDKLLSPSEAKTLGVPYGTRRGEAFGVLPRGAEDTDRENPGDYTDQELRKLRANGIDVQNIEDADRFLYGDGAKRGVLTVSQLESIAQALFDLVGEEFDSVEQVEALVEAGVLEVNGEKVILTEVQMEKILADLNALTEQNKGFFKKIGEGVSRFFGGE